MKEIYYWMMFYFRKGPSKDMYEFNAYLLVSLLFFGNICSIGVIVKTIFNINQEILLDNIDYEAIIVSLTFMTIMFFYLFLKRKGLFNGPIDIHSQTGKVLRQQTIEAGRHNNPIYEVYKGWQKDYFKGR